MTGPDLAEVMYGHHAVHVPAWLYVQHQGGGTVAFVGASHAGGPLRLDSDRTHQFMLGEIVVRPHVAIGTDALRGHGLASLLTSSGASIGEMLAQGEVICDPVGRLATLRKEWP